MKNAIVIANIGTPKSPQPNDVGVYLKEFLMDPEVINLPFLIRWILVNILIVPRRKHKSGEAYQAIWMEEGSPLMVYSLDLQKELQKHMPENWSVHIAMRYGEPNIEQTMLELRDYENVVVVPAFPQYAMATNGSVEGEVSRVVKKHGLNFKVSYPEDFYDQKDYVDGLVRSVQNSSKEFDHYLFSYHGLPENHIKGAEITGPACLVDSNCCDQINDQNKNCYRAHCFATTRAVVKELGLNKDQYSVSFQSRLGPTEWIKPYTDETLKELAQKGARKIAVLCPAFLIDCLETLEEIGIGLKEQFAEDCKSLGSEGELTLIPCLNADPEWSRQFANWILTQNQN